MQNNNMKEQLAIQAANAYKDKTCFYVNVMSRKMKETDPALQMSKTSTVSMNIFDPPSQRGVEFFLDGSTPGYILEKTKLCMSQRMMGAFNPSQENKPNSPAYTLKIRMGKFKDMTPAEVLQNADNYSDLYSYYNMVAKNSEDPAYAKYRQNNLEQMQAVAEAMNLFQTGNLAKCEVNTYPKIPLWEGIKTPDIKKVDQNGNTKVRSAKIFFDSNPSAKEPFSVELMNCMAPPVQGSLVGAKLSQAVNKVTLSMTFSEEAWFAIWNDVLAAKESFARHVEGERIAYSENNKWKPSQQATNGATNNMAYTQYPQQMQNPYYGYQDFAGYAQ